MPSPCTEPLARVAGASPRLVVDLPDRGARDQSRTANPLEHEFEDWQAGQESPALPSGFHWREQEDGRMPCHTPDCTGEHEVGTISHSVLHRERTITIHSVPASICPECGDVTLHEETTIVLEGLLKRKARSKKTAFHYGI